MSAKESLMWDVNRGMSVADASTLHGIDRSCAYKWIARYRAHGEAGLEELSRAPNESPNGTPPGLIAELVALKTKYPDFGPLKLVAILEERHGGHVMAVSTAGELLSKRGLVKRQKPRQRSTGPISHSPFVVAGPGDSMTGDYKGQFRMMNHRLCYPLTVADPVSRFVLALKALGSTHTDPTKSGFERVFREYGIPRQMITDNGTPFCSTSSLGGLTRLSRWWIELGILPIQIDPGHPEQNGIHERMHRTFKAWILRHPKMGLPGLQRSFDAFRKEFNYERPHQSLGQKMPASVFQSYRPFSSRPRTWEYDTNMEVRSVRPNGQMRWKGGLIYVSEVLKGANIGLLPIGDRLWSLHFGAVRIGYLDGVTQHVQNKLPSRIDQSREPEEGINAS